MSEDSQGLVSGRLYVAMKNAGMTQAELGSAMNLTPDKMSKTFSGKRRISSFELALAAEATGRTVSWLLGLQEDDSLLVSSRVLSRGLMDAMDYCADTTTDDWTISYHEAAQRVVQILRDALNASVGFPTTACANPFPHLTHTYMSNGTAQRCLGVEEGVHV